MVDTHLMTTIPALTEYVLQFKLWSQVTIEDPDRFYDSCWLFTGKSRTNFGHGLIKHKGHTYGAHRLAYMLAHGLKELPEEVVCRHKCDVKICCNPLHLETGSQQDNNLDMLLRGRNPKGLTHGMTKFTDTVKIREIRWLSTNAGGVRKGVYSAIAARYGITNTTARYICRRESWQDVQDDFDTLVKPAPLTDAELYTRKENHGGSVVTPYDVQRIRAMRNIGAGLDMIAATFKRSASAVCLICARKTWAEVPDVDPAKVLSDEEIQAAEADANRLANMGPVRAQLTALQVRQIRWAWADALERKLPRYGLRKKLCQKFNITDAMASQIVHRLSWTDVLDNFPELEEKIPLS